jgi:hypothetical protein
VIEEYRAIEDDDEAGNPKKLKENPASVPFYPLQMSHEVIQD